ncbi:class I adenylate-forming enzyme family protein [Saccharomonospora sp. NB11]|uniref:class I adenylate-forming enzyme family protein n=1 Tax=Saccharomonospora sp. NB11 TaxID=1642298 RepID=UPI0027DD6C58|nr:class I adenylate-forming enzyme family protein [Saccharomonospora sp. NB11]
MSSPVALLGPSEVLSKAVGIAADLRRRGIGNADRVAVSAANSPGFVWTLHALVRLGCGVVLLDPAIPEDDLSRHLRRAGVSWLISDLPPGRALDRDDRLTVLHLADLVENASRSATEPPDDTASWLKRPDGLVTVSSGSTGAPKLIARSGQAVVDNMRRTSKRMSYQDTDVLAPLIPFTHQYGMSLVLLARVNALPLLVTPYTRINHTLTALADHGATVVDGTPSTLRSIAHFLRHRDTLRQRLGGVRMWCVGGAPLPQAIAENFASVLGKPLLDGYGSTELGNIALAGPDAPQVMSPLDGVHVKITRPDGLPCDLRETGEIWVDSPDLMSGLVHDDGLRPAPRGWFRTGDFGYFDEFGGLHVIGRRGAVHRHGYTIYPDELARKCAQLGTEVYVVPTPGRNGNVRLVFVVEDPSGADNRAWRARLETLLARYEAPDRVLVLPEFPRLGNGKTDTVRVTAAAEAADYRAFRDTESNKTVAVAGIPTEGR